MNRHKRTLNLFFITFLVVLFSHPVGAKDHKVTTSGSAPIINNDISQARDEAIVDARVKAVEEVVGIIVNAKTAIENELMIKSEIYTEAKGFVKDFDVLKEGADQRGIYSVKISATVSDDLLEDELIKLLKEDRIIIFAAEKNLGENDNRKILENKLIEKLTEVGYENLIGHQMIRNVNGFPIPDDLNVIDLKFAKKMGVYFLADVVIVGEIASEKSQKFRDNFFSAHANGFIRVFKAYDGKYLAGVEKTQVKGFGKNELDAGTQALEMISEEMIEEVLKEITPLQYRSVEVIFYNVPTFAEYRKYKNLLSLFRWVKSVEEDPLGYNCLKSIFKLQYGEHPDFIATRLDRITELEVVSTSDKKIEVKVKN